jgi:hypothetical protein
VREAVCAADVLLPGEPADGGQDPRWQAIIAVGQYITSEPEAVWAFVQRWGGHPREDLRDAVATCLLEHLLEYHFTVYFPRVRALALAEPLFGDTFLRCWQLGQSREPGNSERFEVLSEALWERRRC